MELGNSNEASSTIQDISSPSPIAGSTLSNHEDDEACDDELRALAAALAPSILETEEILQVPMEFRINTDLSSKKDGADEVYDDDDLDDEVDALKSSEALLRQELDMAQDFSSLFQFTQIMVSDEHDEYDRHDGGTKTPTNSDPIAHNKTSELSHGEEDETEDYGVDESLTPIKLEQEFSTAKVKTHDGSTPSHNDDEAFLLFHPSPSLSLRRHRYNPMPYTIHDHQRALSLRKELHGGWYSVSIVRHFGITVPQPSDSENSNPANLITLYDDAVREYCLSIPAPTLQKLFVGLPERNVPTTSNSIDEKDASDSAPQSKPRVNISSPNPPLPVRTITMRIRPDVLCGAVMEVVHHVFVELHIHVTKRQGGHIQGVAAQKAITSEALENITNSISFMVDVRLVTSKSETFDRVLLIRIYHFNLDVNEDISDDIKASLSMTDDTAEGETSLDNPNDILCENNVSLNVASHVREASALIQIMESPKDVKKRIIHRTSDINVLTHDDMINAVSKHLLANYRACPSVVDAGITLPSLNAEDFAIVVASGDLIQMIWDEIEIRDLAYITLRSSRFGSFPSLPTLDVHYCSQLRRISREAMTKQLVQSASELEQYAREAEMACANMITLLKPTFAVYGIEAPQLPKPKELTEYPFDFVPSNLSCPPWGVKVQHAMNEIQAWTGDVNGTDAPESHIFLTTHSSQYSDRSIENANAAVRLILEAFQKQDDDEQSARLERKNVQVMDRLAKMQAHELLSIQTIQNCYNISDKAMLAAQNFHAKCGIREVPLLKWTIMVGRSTGTCTISANHILFVTKLIPVLGGNKTDVFNVDDVDLIIEDNVAATATLLNPLPTIIYVKQNRRTMYTFRPSMGAARLMSFFNVVKSAASRKLFDVSN